MRKMPILLAFLMVVNLATLAFSSEAFALIEFGARGYVWFTELDSRIQTDLDPTALDLKDDLNMADEDIPGGEAFLRIGRLNFIVGYMAPSFSGTSTQSFTFNGVTFTGTINSKLEYDQVDGIFQFDLIKFNPAITRFYLGLIVQAKYLTGSVEVTDSLGGDTKESFDLPIPMVGVGAGFGIFKDLVLLEGRFTGISYSGDTSFDGQALLSLSPLPLLKIYGGYRIFEIDVDEDNLKLDYTLKGPLAGIQLSF